MGLDYVLAFVMMESFNIYICCFVYKQLCWHFKPVNKFILFYIKYTSELTPII